MLDRLVTKNEWYKLKNLGLCTIENDGTILFTLKAKKKYRVLRDRLYDLHWIGKPEGQVFEVPKFTKDHIQKNIGNYGDNMIILTKYSFVKFWEELKPLNIFKEIEL
jgi:hypothetical protein